MPTVTINANSEKQFFRVTKGGGGGGFPVAEKVVLLLLCNIKWKNEPSLVKKKKNIFFFLRFLKNRPILRPILAGEFRHHQVPGEKNANWREFHTLIVSRQFAPIRVFFREKTAKYKTRIGANWGNQGRILGYLLS